MSLSDWSRFSSWQLVLPPNRPDTTNLQHLRSVCALLPSQRLACILGSTPEYRVVLGEMFDEVVLIDRSLEFKGYSDAISGQIPGERFIHGDWLDALPTLGGFDLIASHYTHGNVTYAERSKFFRQIAGALAPGGIFFDTVFNPPADLYSLPQIARRFANLPTNLQTFNDFNAVAIFQSEVIRSMGRIDTDAIYDSLERKSPNSTFDRLIEGTMMMVTPRGLSWDYDPDRPPEDLGYHQAFRVQYEQPERLDSAFAGAVRTLVSRPHGV